MYRQCIALAKKSYSKAPNRLRKSIIVSEIVNTIHSSNGRFLKRVYGQDEEWVECEENFIREKVTQSLRDGLSFKYSSSTTRKRERKAKVQEIFFGDIDRIVHSNIEVSRKIIDLKKKVQGINHSHGADDETQVSDEKIMKLFDRANFDILETIKKDRSMIEQMHRATTPETKLNIRQVFLSSTPGTVVAPETPLSPHNTTKNASVLFSSMSTSIKSEPKFQFDKNRSYDSDDSMDLDFDSTSSIFLDEIEEHL